LNENPNELVFYALFQEQIVEEQIRVPLNCKIVGTGLSEHDDSLPCVYLKAFDADKTLKYWTVDFSEEETNLKRWNGLYEPFGQSIECITFTHAPITKHQTGLEKNSFRAFSEKGDVFEFNFGVISQTFHLPLKEPPSFM
jgi:hypothetical protein